jgi:hypothetical protein
MDLRNSRSIRRLGRGGLKARKRHGLMLVPTPDDRRPGQGEGPDFVGREAGERGVLGAILKGLYLGPIRPSD